MIKYLVELNTGDILDRAVESCPLIVISNELDYRLDGEESTLHNLELAPIDLSDDCREWIASNHTDWHLTLQELKQYNVIGQTDPNTIKKLKPFTIKY